MGALTAGAWDDNLNFSFYLGYLASPPSGAPPVAQQDRVVVTVLDRDGAPAPGALVHLQQGHASVESTVGADGRFLHLPSFGGMSSTVATDVTVTFGGSTTHGLLAAGARSLDLTVPGVATPVVGLDIAVVLDTTGSMGDEIAWLKAELHSIAQAIEAAHPTLSVRWALIDYKDTFDPYLTRVTDFTTLQNFSASLDCASASGGGDLPEAVDAALAKVPALAWRGGAVARMAFHLADAPHHDERAGNVADALKQIRAKGIHLYPVAASGATPQAEFSFRQEAQVTGGRYLFLTDDSGIGNSHEEPTLPCYLVTFLSKQFVRMVETELTGTRIEPAVGDVLRTGGDPANGACTLGNGTRVFVL